MKKACSASSWGKTTCSWES